jgi:hypothetical protein
MKKKQLLLIHVNHKTGLFLRDKKLYKGDPGNDNFTFNLVLGCVENYNDQKMDQFYLDKLLASNTSDYTPNRIISATQMDEILYFYNVKGFLPVIRNGLLHLRGEYVRFIFE